MATTVYSNTSVTVCSDECLLHHSSAKSKSKVGYSTTTTRRYKKQSTSNDRGVLGRVVGQDRGCGRGQGRGNGKTNGQSTSQESLVWLIIDITDNFFKPNAVQQYLEDSRPQRFTKYAESPLDQFLLFFPDHFFEQVTIESFEIMNKIRVLTSHNHKDSGFGHHSTKPELRFCTGSNPNGDVLEIGDGEDI